MSVQQKRGYYSPLLIVVVSSSNDLPPPAEEEKSSGSPIRHTRKKARQQTMFQATRSTWGLPDKLTALSEGDTWAIAIREWEVIRLRKFMYPKECLCDLSSKKICYK